MGIPRLTTLLQTYGDRCVLQDENVVIDGPALAYHVLHLCRLNNVVQPSYRLVADAALAWLNELSIHGVAVKAIYFDGHLPSSKRDVRMQRLTSSYAQIRKLFSGNPLGCPRIHLAAVGGQTHHLGQIDVDVFKSGFAAAKSFADPSFFVPAVIDALRYSDRYQKLVSVVPGEADAACARHVAQHGGLVLTSDSDLLVYDLKAGKVAFFRDLQKNEDSSIVFTSFKPVSICEKLGIPRTTGLLRVAYELQLTYHATLPQIVRACQRPVADSSGYLELHKKYQHDSADDVQGLRDSRHQPLARLTTLDPRLSELVVQLYSAPFYSRSPPVADMFLPVLIEDLNRGTAWQQSIPIRRLAYTLLDMFSPRQSVAIREFRRVQHATQKGRLVESASTTEGQQYIDEILNVIKRIKGLACISRQDRWPLVGLSLDIAECQTQGKNSHAWHMFQQQHRQLPTGAHRVGWDVVHFYAQVQAALYSLRMLRQVLCLVREGSTSFGPRHVAQLWSAMQDFPPLSSFPDLDDTLELLLKSGEPGFVQKLGQLMPADASRGEAEPGWVDEDIWKLAGETNSSDKANKFGPLFIG